MTASFNLLLEILTEEIPYTLQKQSIVDIEKLFQNALNNNNINFENIKVFATPRRLTTLITGLPKESTTKHEEKKGPRVNANPQAIEGFLRQNNLQQTDLVIKGDFYMANIITKGQDIQNIIGNIITNEVLAKMSFKKSMYWEETGVKWARPIRNLLCILENLNNTQFININFASLHSNSRTMGHRFLGSIGYIAVSGIKHYFETLKENYVILDQNERREYIKQQAEKLAKSKGGKLLENWVLDEVNFLNEYPVLLLDSIPQKYLDLPPEAIITIMANNQRYLNIVDNAGNLLPHYIIIANNKAVDEGVEIINGNNKVLVARLQDGLFFYNNDLKIPLINNVEKLKNITWFEGLGSYYDKVNRMYEIMVSDWFKFLNPFNKAIPLSNNQPNSFDLTEVEKEKLKYLAYLSKADLVSQMVLEIPELQGIMGSYYIQKQAILDNKYSKNDIDVLALAVKTQYEYLDEKLLPLNTEKSLAVALILADKIDTLEQMFNAGHIPTGSSDPFALRRAALVVIKLFANFSFNDPQVNNKLAINNICKNEKLKLFLQERLFVYLQEHFFLTKDDVLAGNLYQNLNELSINDIGNLAIKHKELLNKNTEYKEVLTLINRIQPLLELSTKIDNDFEIINKIQSSLLLTNEEKEIFNYLQNDWLKILNELQNTSKIANINNKIIALTNYFFNANIRINDDNENIKNNRLLLLNIILNILKAMQINIISKHG